jgi:hypothetical protein
MTESEQRMQFYKDMDKLLGNLDYEMLIQLSKALGIHKHIIPNQSVLSTIHDISNRCLANGVSFDRVKAVVDEIISAHVTDPTLERLAWLDARITEQRAEIQQVINHPTGHAETLAARTVKLQACGLLLNSYLQEKAILLGAKNV